MSAILPLRSPSWSACVLDIDPIPFARVRIGEEIRLIDEGVERGASLSNTSRDSAHATGNCHDAVDLDSVSRLGQRMLGDREDRGGFGVRVATRRHRAADDATGAPNASMGQSRSIVFETAFAK